MREPILTSSRRRRARGVRLLRMLGAVVLLVAVVALVVRFVGGEDEEALPTPQVAFKASVTPYSEAREKPQGRAVDAEADKITTLLDRWYQSAFVDPKLWGDGTFPRVRSLFAQQARKSFRADLDSLTIGEARTELVRVVPKRARAKISLFFDENGTPRFAVAEVEFRASGTPRAEESQPVAIVQEAVLHLRTQKGGAWQVFAYDAKQRQDSVPPPRPTP